MVSVCASGATHFGGGERSEARLLRLSGGGELPHKKLEEVAARFGKSFVSKENLYSRRSTCTVYGQRRLQARSNESGTVLAVAFIIRH